MAHHAWQHVDVDCGQWSSFLEAFDFEIQFFFTFCIYLHFMVTDIIAGDGVRGASGECAAGACATRAGVGACARWRGGNVRGEGVAGTGAGRAWRERARRGRGGNGGVRGRG